MGAPCARAADGGRFGPCVVALPARTRFPRRRGTVRTAVRIWRGSPYPPRFSVLGRRDDVILELFRLGQCHQRPVDDSDSGAIHRSDLRGDALATATTESASALQDLALSTALRARLSGLAVHVCLRRLAVYLARPGDAGTGRCCLLVMVAKGEAVAVCRRRSISPTR